MRICILDAGVPYEIGGRDPGYAGMVQGLIGADQDYTVAKVSQDEFPGAQTRADAYVITGSSAGVYDDFPWIGRLRDWLRAADPEVPMIGLCFGHQILADAYGGQVIRSPKGWVGGLQTYAVAGPAPWMDSAAAFAVAAAHQDQVVVAPAETRLIASSDACPIAALAYDDRAVLSFQGHPEFSNSVAADLVERRRARGSITGDQADQLLKTLERPSDSARIAGWIRRFIGAG